MRFNSEESFAEMDENGNMENTIRVEVMELKPVEIKKASEERARGDPFGKMVKCDEIVYIFHGEGSQKEGRQLTRLLSWSKPSEISFLRSLLEHLL
jgi:hypothetical protein